MALEQDRTASEIAMSLTRAQAHQLVADVQEVIDAWDAYQEYQHRPQPPYVSVRKRHEAKVRLELAVSMMRRTMGEGS